MRRRINGTQLKLFGPEKTGNKQGGLGKQTSENNIVAKVKPRRLKIQYGQYQGSYKRHPVIRLAGDWLRNFDFQVGDYVDITIEKGHMCISKIQTEE